MGEWGGEEGCWLFSHTHTSLPLLPSPVEFVDVGCGFGGLTVELARLHPESLVMGMEIRYKVHKQLGVNTKSLKPCTH